MDFKEIMQKKVVGVPVVYLAIGFVVILVVVAYAMKPNVPVDTGEVEGAPEDGSDAATDAEGNYAGLANSGGTVVVAPVTPTPTAAVEQTNDMWERTAVTYLIEEKGVNPGDAQKAIHTYLEGNDLTFEQGQWRDMAIAKLKLPPEPLITIGGVGVKADPPAQKQFNAQGTHTVKGSNDNTAAKLAMLYYGNNDANFIVSNNFGAGTATSTYLPGTKIIIKAYPNPRYYVTKTANEYPTNIAKANGISFAQLTALNPGMVFPVAKGVKVRVL